ncbi:MAG: hypothetical protein ACRD4Q_01170 [Candidatus Acidiferrales bacterium]
MAIVIGIALAVGALIIIGEVMSGSFDNASASYSPTAPVSPYPVTNSVTSALANAIARAEGFFSEGSIPSSANNPGDIEIGDQGQGTIAGKTVFGTLDAGWNALYNQINLMLTGRSSVYDPSMTINQVAQLYTGGDQASAWANNVASALGVTPDTTLSDLQNSYGGA